MALSSFELDLGTYQGRIPDGNGGFVVELGHAQRIVAEFSEDATHALSQQFTFDAPLKLVRAHARIRAPLVAGTRAGWAFRMRLDGVVYYFRSIHADGREVALRDLAVPAVDTGTHTVTFELALLFYPEEA